MQKGASTVAYLLFCSSVLAPRLVSYTHIASAAEGLCVSQAAIGKWNDQTTLEARGRYGAEVGRMQKAYGQQCDAIKQKNAAVCQQVCLIQCIPGPVLLTYDPVLPLLPSNAVGPNLSSGQI